MSDETIKILTRLADEFETIDEAGHQSPPSQALPRSFVVAHIRAIVVSYRMALEAVQAVQRMEGKS
jgi:hypothetical protein